MTHQEKMTHRHQLTVTIVIALGLVALFAGLWRNEREKKNIVFSSVDTTFLQDPNFDSETFFLQSRVDSSLDVIKALNQRLTAQKATNYLVIEESVSEPTDLLRERLLAYCREMDDTTVKLTGEKLVNFRIAENYTSRGELRIKEIQLLNCQNVVDDFRDLDTIRVKRILELQKGARAIIADVDTCNHLLLTKGLELSKVKKERNYWRVGGLVAFMTSLLLLLK